MRYSTATDGATVKINGAMNTSWQVTIEGNRTITMYSFEPGNTVTLKIIQGTAGGYTVTWPSSILWPAGAPTLKVTGGATDVFNFNYDGTYFHPISAVRSLLNKVTDNRAQSVIGGVSVVALSLAVTTGIATLKTGNLPAVVDIFAGTGANIGSGTSLSLRLAQIDGSGSYKTGQSGAIAVGLNTVTGRYDTGLAYITPAGNVFGQAISGTTLTVGSAAISSITTALSFTNDLTLRGTLSGAVLKGGGGDTVIDGTGIETIDTASGRTISGGGGLVNITSTGAIEVRPFILYGYGVVCVGTGGHLGTCASVVDAAGNCTCTVP